MPDKPRPCVDNDSGRLCWSITKSNQLWVEIEVYEAESRSIVYSSWGSGKGSYSKIADKITRVPDEVYKNLFIRFDDAAKSW